MSNSFTLITAVLMTMAALTWLFSAVMLPHESGSALLRWGVVAVFALMAAFLLATLSKAEIREPNRNGISHG